MSEAGQVQGQLGSSNWWRGSLTSPRVKGQSRTTLQVLWCQVLLRVARCEKLLLFFLGLIWTSVLDDEPMQRKWVLLKLERLNFPQTNSDLEKTHSWVWTGEWELNIAVLYINCVVATFYLTNVWQHSISVEGTEKLQRNFFTTCWATCCTRWKLNLFCLGVHTNCKGLYPCCSTWVQTCGTPDETKTCALMT